MRREHVYLVGYGDFVVAQELEAERWWELRDSVHTLAWEYARLQRDTHGGTLYVLSEWHGLVGAPWRLPSRPEGPRLVTRLDAEQRRWAAGVVAQLLLAHGGRWLDVEVHAHQAHLTILRSCLPHSWRESEPLRGCESKREAWYRDELPRVRRLAELARRDGGGA